MTQNTVFQYVKKKIVIQSKVNIFHQIQPNHELCWNCTTACEWWCYYRAHRISSYWETCLHVDYVITVLRCASPDPAQPAACSTAGDTACNGLQQLYLQLQYPDSRHTPRWHDSDMVRSSCSRGPASAATSPSIMVTLLVTATAVRPLVVTLECD